MAFGNPDRYSQYRRPRRFCYVGFGLAFALVALIVLCISFTTDHWLHYDVDRDALRNIDPTDYGYTQAQFDKLHTEDSKFYTRRRGLFRTCYCGNVTWEFKEAKASDKDGACLREIAFDSEEEDILSPNYEDDNIELRKNLMICHLAFFILGILFLAIGIIVATVGCWCMWIRAFIVACVVCFLAALVLLLGMVFFHWYQYLEENELDFDSYGRKAWRQEPFLDDNTAVTYNYSYALGWVAFIFTFLAGVFFALAAWSTRRKKDQDDAGIVKNSPMPQQQQYQPAPVPQQTSNQDGTVYVINHYPSTEKLVQPQPQYVPQSAPPPQQVILQPYPTKPVYTNHTVYQSALPPGETNVFN